MNHCRGGFASGGGFVVQDGTALHWAAYYGSFEIAKLLIEKGAGVVLLTVVYMKLKNLLLCSYRVQLQ